MAQDARGVAALPSAAELVRLARARLASELERLPPLGSLLLLAWLRTPATPRATSSGALVHLLRTALRAGDLRGAHAVFVLLLERRERSNRQ